MRFVLYLVPMAYGLVFLYAGTSNSGNWTIHDRSKVERKVTLGPAGRVVVDNLEGFVHVRGGSGSEVQVSAERLTSAATQGDLDRAKEVTLKVENQDGVVSIYYDAPWRCRGHKNCDGGDRHRDYRVLYNIDVVVPERAAVEASTVNEGDVRLEKTGGDFKARNVNGGVEVKDAGGSGDASTVNGPVKVEFAKNPTGPSKFRTVNGGIDVYFQKGLSADLAFSTFNGSVYSNFDVTPVASSSAVAERKGTQFVYHSSRNGRVRAGQGGQELSFNVLNGDIRLHEAGREKSSE